MTARILSALLVSLALCGARAQTTPPPKPAAGDEAKPAVPETPPDQKAYSEASKIIDPEKKIAALEKLRTDYPDTRYAFLAESQIFNTLIEKMPQQTDRIRKAAKALFAKSAAWDKAASKQDAFTTRANRSSTATRIADQLATSGLLLKDAESYARKGVEGLHEGVWRAERRESYAKMKLKIPAVEDLAKEFAELRAARIGTLGRVEMKLGRTAEARKLLEESYAVTPDDAKVAGALGEMAAQAGNDAKAMDYLIPVRLSGHAPDSANRAFEAIYKKNHNGSLDGVEAMLDAEYHKRFPNPIHLEAYKPTEKRSDRVVLAEVFTGSGCPPCAGADVAFDAALERYLCQNRTAFATLLDGPLPLRRALAAQFDLVVGYLLSPDGQPCFLAQAALERAASDPASAQCVQGAFNQSLRRLEDRLKRAQAEGELGPHHDPAALARFFQNTLFGLQITARSGASRADLEAIVRVNLSVLG